MSNYWCQPKMCLWHTLKQLQLHGVVHWHYPHPSTITTFLVKRSETQTAFSTFNSNSFVDVRSCPHREMSTAKGLWDPEVSSGMVVRPCLYVLVHVLVLCFWHASLVVAHLVSSCLSGLHCIQTQWSNEELSWRCNALYSKNAKKNPGTVSVHHSILTSFKSFPVETKLPDSEGGVCAPPAQDTDHYTHEIHDHINATWHNCLSSEQ